MGEEKKSSSGTWLKGCAMGCGVVAFLGLVATVGGSMVMMQPFRDAVDSREALVERHGEVNEFTPWPDGRIPADRMEAFLHVRRAVQQRCAEFRDTNLQFEALDELDDEDSPGRMEILGAGWQAATAAFGMGPLMGEFFRTRNEALTEVEMGLGEYSYVFACAYGPTLVRPGPTTPTPGGEPDGGPAAEETYLSRRVRETLRQQLRNQLAAMASLGEGADTEARRLLEEEIRALEEHPGRLPWQGVRPVALEESLAPYRESLDELFCPDSLSLELTRNRRFLVGIQGD